MYIIQSETSILDLHFSGLLFHTRRTFEIIISERRGLEEIIAFNRNKTDQHIEKWQQLY